MSLKSVSPPFNGGLIGTPIYWTNMSGTAVSASGQGGLRYNNGTSAFEVSISGGAWTALATTAGETWAQVLTAGSSSVGGGTNNPTITAGDSIRFGTAFGIYSNGSILSLDSTVVGNAAATVYLGKCYSSSGSATAPTYSFQSGTNVGWYTDGTNLFGSVNGVNAFALKAMAVYFGNGATNTSPVNYSILGTGGSGASSNGAGLTLAAGAGGTTTSTGGLLTLNDGAGGSTSGNGGGITIQCTTPTSGSAGALQILGGAGVGGNNTGSTVTITAGASVGSGTGGAVNVTAGAGGTTNGTAGGGVTFTTGAGITGTNNPSGSMTFALGNSTGNSTPSFTWKGPPTGSSGSGSNTAINILNLSNSGSVNWPTGLSSFTLVNLYTNFGHLLGPADNTYYISANNTTTTGQAIQVSGGNGNQSSSTGGNAYFSGGFGNDSTSKAIGGGVLSCFGGVSGSSAGSAQLSGGQSTSTTTPKGGYVSVTGGAGAAGATNAIPGYVYMATGQGTGNAASYIQFQAYFTGASGTTLQNAGDRFYIAGHSVTMSTTSATAESVGVINVPTSNSGGGCMVIYQIVATDGTNYDTVTGSFCVSCSNKAGTVTATTSAVSNEADNANSGTLTGGTTSATVSSTAVTIKMAPAWTTIVPTSVIANVTFVPFGNGVTMTPA